MAYDPSRASPVKEPKAQSDITLDALLDEFEVSDPAVRDRVLRLAGVESGGNLNATGPRVNGGMHNGTRARGALQIMPATAKAYPQYDLNDPADASRAGLHYFLDNLNQFGGDLDAATIAHHAGPGTAKKWLREGRAGTVDRATGLSTDDYLLKVTGGKRAKPADNWWESDPVAPAEAAGNWWESDPVEPAEAPGLLERGWSALKDTLSAPSGEPVDVRPHPGEKAPAAAKLDSVMADYRGEQSTRQTPANAQTRAFVHQQYDAHPEKREAMLSRPDWLGDIARQIDAEYQAMNPAESLKPFDQRREAKLARNRAQGMDPATAEMTTASQMIGGEAPVGSIKASDFDFDLKQRYEGANPAIRGAVKGYEGYRQGILGFLQAGADLVGADFASGQFRQGAREAAGQAAAIGEGEAGARLFEGAVASLTQQLPLLIGGSIAGGQALILSGMAAQAFGQEYSEGRQAGLDGQDAATRASLFAAFEVIGEKFGLSNQLAALRMAYKGVPTKQLVAELGAALAKEIPGEVLTTTGQFLTDKAPQIGLNPEAGMAQYLSQVADTIGQTIIQGGLMMGGASAVSRGARAMQRPEPDLTAGRQFDPGVNDALARQALDPSNAQETADVAPPLDAASYQGPGADPAGGAGLASDGGSRFAGTGDATGAPARSGEPGVSVGEAERQQVASVVEQTIAQKEAEAAATGDPIELLVTRAEGAALRRAVTPQPANGIDIDQDALLADVEAMFTEGGNLMVQGDNAREAVKRIDPKALASALPRGDGALLVPQRFAGPVMDALQGAKQRVSVAFGGDGMMQAPDVAQFRATVPTQEEVQDVPKAEQVAPQATEARGQEGEAAADGRVTRDRPMNDGATVTDAEGNQYRVHYQRNDLVIAHPIVNGKPQVSADTTVRFWTNQDVAPSGENDRTDPIYPVAQPTEAWSSIEGEPASWVIRNKETGEAVMETFDRAKVDALNTKKYEAVPILQHLQEVNRDIKETQAPTASEQSSPAPAQTQSADKPKRQPPARKPDPVTVDRAQRNAEDLRAMAQDAGWAEEGGKLIRDAEGKASRTKWIPRAEWFLSGMEARPDVLAQHIEAAARGEWIPMKSARTIEGMVEWLGAQRGQATLDEDASMYDFEASFGDVLDVPDAREVAEFFDDAFGDFAEQSEADAMRAMGFTEEEIANAVGQAQAGAGSAETADARGTAESGERAGEAGAAQEEEGQGQREGLNAQQRDERRRAQAVQALAPLGWDVSEGRAEKTFEGTKLGSGYNNITKSTLTASVSGGFINLYSGWDRIGSVAITANMAPDAVAAELNKKAEAWAQDRKAAKEERAKPLLQSNGKPFPSEKLAAESARQRKLDMVPVEVDGGWGLAQKFAEPLALDTYTNADIAQREAEQQERADAEAKAERDAAAKQRQAEERAEVRRRSEAAADTFELGMDPMENLTGQGGLFGQADPAPQPARPAAPAASANTIFTEDAAEKARALLRRKLGQVNSGVDPEMLQAGITLAGYHIEKGARSFAAYARAMLGDLGDAVRPYLKSWYMGVKYDPRATGFDGMDSAAVVEAADENADFIGMAQQEQGNGTDERGDSGVESDRRDAEAQDGMGEEGLRAEPGRDAAGRGQGVQGARAGGGARRSGELSGREAAPARERGDLTVYTGATDVPGSAARSDLDRRSADPGLDGAPIEPDAAKAIEDAARGGSRLAETRAAQAQAAPPDETRFQAFQRKAQDKLNRFTVIKEWLAAQGVTLSEQADVYKAEERMHSRFANKAEDFREKTVKPLVEQIQRAGYSMDDVAQYLHAQHAEERNIQVASINKQMPDGGSGMKTADANAILAAAPAELRRLANEFRAITERTKQILLDNGIISQDMADAWDAAYQHYVPLKGGPEQGGKGAGNGLKANYKGKRALGHTMREEGEWIVENILADHERAIMLAEKNRIGQSLLKMAIEVGRDDLLTVGKPEKRGVLKSNTAYEVLFKGKVIGSFQSLEAARTFRATAPAAMKGASPSEFGIRKVSDPTVAYMASPMLAENEVNVYVRGQAIRVQINDELLARAYGNMGVEALGAILRVGATINGYFSKIYTGYNPEFILTNIVRDFTTGVANVTGEEGAMMALRAAKDYPSSFADLFRYATTGNASQWIRMYREDGGNTGAAYLSDLERLGDEISTEYAAYKGVLANLKAGDVKSAARAAGRKAFDKTLVWVERINQAGENAMRLAIYKAMIESGKSRAEAASLAKNATVNFNRNGEVGRQMNALWLFYNAGVQGTAAIAHANLKGRHKWQARAVSAGILGLGYTMAVALGAGDDEDDYDKLSDYTKARNVVIKTGDGWLKIPVPYGYGFFWNVGRAIADAERKGEWGKAPWHVASSFIEEFTPFGAAFAGDDLTLEQVTLGALPTLAQIPASVGMNRTTMGGPMYPESAFDKYQPDNEKMWRATKGTIPDMIAQALDQGGIEVSPETIKYLTRTFTGGAGQFVTSIGDAAWLTANGASLEVKEQPFVRKFYTETDVREARSAYHAAVAEAEKAVREGKSILKMGDHAAYGAYRVENQEFYALDRMAKARAAAIKARRNYADAIRADKSLSVKEKRDKLKEAEAQEQVIYDRYLEVFKSRARQ